MVRLKSKEYFKGLVFQPARPVMVFSIASKRLSLSVGE